VRRSQPSAERELRVRAVDARHPRVGDERDLPLARHEPAQLLERTDSDVDAAGRQDDVIGVAGSRVRRIPVERVAFLEQGAKPALVLREGPVAAAGSPPGVLDVDLQLHGHRALPEQPASRLARHRAAAQGDDCGVRLSQRPADGLGLQHTEGGFAPLAEDLRDRPPGLPLDLAIEVDEFAPQAVGDLAADGRLAGAHEADEGDVPV
jgi:hypothetical protein